MLKKLSVNLLFFGLLSACSQAENTAIHRAEIWQPRIDLPNSVVVCRSKQCAPAKLSMSKEYIYNSLLHLLDNNTQNKALVCTADAASHVCTEQYLSIPITVGVTPANMYIDAVKITDISASLGNQSLSLILNYDVTYNGQTPTCKPAQSLLYVKNASNILLEDGGYGCKMTTIGNTTIKTLFAIDYVDLDYGYIGGYYSIGLSGPAYGGGSGYMLLRLPNDAYPLTPALTAPAEEPDILADPTAEEISAGSEQTAKTQAQTEVIPCANKRNCSPASTKKMMLKEPALPNENPKSISQQLAKPKTYNGVEVFPILPKKKAAPVQPETAAEPENSVSQGS